MPLAQLLEHLHEAFIVTDVEIDPPGPRILYVNAAFTRMTGYSREELAGQSPRLLQGPGSDRARGISKTRGEENPMMGAMKLPISKTKTTDRSC